MSNDYLWNRSGIPDLDVKALEDTLAPLAHDAPLDELRTMKARKRELVRATAQEPEQPRGKMRIFDKYVIGGASLVVAAIALVAVFAVDRHRATSSSHDDAVAALAMPRQTATMFAMTPHDGPVAPTAGADLAFTAGESARIHVPFGSVTVEIQTPCTSVVTVWAGRELEADHPEDPFISHLFAVSEADPGAASRTHTFQLGAGRFEYAALCLGRPSMAGTLIVDHDDSHDPIKDNTNARVFSLDGTMTAPGGRIHVFGVVMPGARVFTGATPIPLEAVDPDLEDPAIDLSFTTDIPVTRDHLVAAVRVDDARGTNFYVIHPAELVMYSCDAMFPIGEAEQRDIAGDHAGALAVIQRALQRCAPSAETWSIALTYACKARDVAAARTYWHKLLAEGQTAGLPVCEQNGITRAQLSQ